MPQRMSNPSDDLEVTEDASRGPETSDSPTSAFGRYEVESVLGTGGCGTVYLARDPSLDREVAIKCLHPATTGDVQAERIRSEAQALAQLSHPNVVPIYDVGQRDGSTYIVMRKLAGPTLRQWMREAHPHAKRISVLCAAGEGLLAAHELGLVHRDFKPDNVLLDDDGQPRVVDFGLVRSIEGAATESPSAADLGDPPPIDRLTRTGALTGTPAYMAPEQFSGKEVDARSDQFAFCVVIFEALEGRRPFDGAGVADLVANLEELDRAQLGQDSQWASNLMPILRRGLARDPDDRFEGMRGLLSALRGAGRTRARRWWPLIGAGAAAVALGGVLASGDTHERGEPKASAAAVAAPRFTAEFAPLETARADLAAGRFPAALQATEAALDVSRDPRERAAAMLLQSQALHRMLQIPQAREAADRALELTEGIDAPELRLEALLAVFEFMRTRHRDESKRLQEAESLINRLDVPDQWRGQIALSQAWSAHARSDAERAQLETERGLQFVGDDHPSPTRSLLLATGAVAAYQRSTEPVAIRMLDEALADLPTYDDLRPDAAFRLRLVAANLLASVGRSERAERFIADTTARIAETPDVPLVVAAEVQFVGAVVAYQAGRYEAAVVALERVTKDVEGDAAAWKTLGPRAQLLDFQLANVQGDETEAFTKVRVLLDTYIAVYGTNHNQTIATQIMVANFETLNGVFDSSRARLVEVLEKVEPNSIRAADVECALARLAKAQAQLERVREHASACVEIYESLNGRVGYRAQARSILAESLAELGRDKEAAKEFELAHAELVEAGEAWWVERRQLLVVAKRFDVELPSFEDEGDHGATPPIEAIDAGAGK